MKNKQKPMLPRPKMPGVELSGVTRSWMGPALALALLLNPFAYAAAQESSSTSQPANVPAQSALEASQPAPSSTETPVPPLPPAPPLPDSPGSVQSAQLDPAPPPAQALPQSQPRPNEPLGTAAAETLPTIGIAASQPAGAALAPAKQRRVRTILIRVGAVLGVGAAVGVTMALSEGSPSKPPGAH